MLGGFTFELKSKRLNYSFTISRKITLVVGDSATGKTELCRLLHDSRHPNTGINVRIYQILTLSDWKRKYWKFPAAQVIKNKMNLELYCKNMIIRSLFVMKILVIWDQMLLQFFVNLLILFF